MKLNLIHSATLVAGAVANSVLTADKVEADIRTDK